MNKKELFYGIKYGLWSIVSPKNAHDDRTEYNKYIPSELEEKLMFAGLLIHVLVTFPYQIYYERKNQR